MSSSKSKSIEQKSIKLNSPKLNIEALEKIEQQSKKNFQEKKDYTVLCVDDEIVNLKTLKNLLEDYYNVFIAENAEQGLNIVENNIVDVIITDQRMPGMQGTEFLEELKKRELSDNIRIILTGYTDINDLIDCINNGLIDRYLIKPWNAEELLGIIKDSISRITTKRTLNKLLPDQFIKNLYPEGLEAVKVGYGAEVQCVILFADIRHFTTLAENMQALDAFKMISSYFNYISPIVDKYYGFIDKFLGDGIMAIFNRKEKYTNDAVLCSIALVEATQKYNAIHRKTDRTTLQPGQSPRDPLSIGMGLYSGEVVLGTVGFDNRLDFTVLGDTVNTASRVQGLTSRLNIPIVIPEQIAQKNEKHILKRYI
ncbi:MAG: response regulator, partial [Bdellovibrionales bacterium]|nr:response regulator [Bdellovibrionales bacterium]